MKLFKPRPAHANFINFKRLHARSLPVFRDIAFNPNPIEEYLPMEPLHPMVFDRFCEDGWCYWSDIIFRRNLWEWRGEPCRVILLRIRLDGFQLSKSQRKCLRRNADLRVLRRPLNILKRHEELFELHARRFHYNRPVSIYGFFSTWSHAMPSTGVEFDVFEGNRHLASSFFHVGHRSMAGNYCIHDPEEAWRSLGTYTMLLEIEYARYLGKEFYYPGFVYDLPSEFDYKLNFHNLEAMDWKTGLWSPQARVPVGGRAPRASIA